MKKPRTSYRPLSKEEQLRIEENLRENPPTRKDIAALIISLLITLLPRLLLILGILFGIIWFLFIK